MQIVARAAPLNVLSSLPAVDRVLGFDSVRPLVEAHGRTAVLGAARALLERLRAQLREGLDAGELDEASIGARLAADIARSNSLRLRRVINLTGTVLHTNLGRAPMPEEAVSAVSAAMRGFTNLEYDIASGARGDRDDLVVPILAELIGCESATVVNNNAAAVLLALNTLGRGKEVVVSRGEQIEIGGAFRLPDILARAGCRLREVGTTNRTHLGDFAEAIGPATAMVLKVHRSNYAVTGFTAEVGEAELGALARERGIPMVVDLGSGALVDLSRWGLPREPTPRESIASGASLVTFSGDKLLGGPQAGIVVGTKDLVSRLKKNPLKRALRVDKMTLAALEAVLGLYRDPDRLGRRLAALEMLVRPAHRIRAAAERVAPVFALALGAEYAVGAEDCASQIGSGAQPVELLPSAAIVMRPVGKRGAGTRLARLEGALRALPVPIVGRVEDGALLLDLRCLEDEEELGRLAGMLSA